MVSLKTLKLGVLEQRAGGENGNFFRSKARDVVDQFKAYPEIVPKGEITLYNYSDTRQMKQFRETLLEELRSRGYGNAVVARDSQGKYSIDVDNFLGLSGDGRVH